MQSRLKRGPIRGGGLMKGGPKNFRASLRVPVRFESEDWGPSRKLALSCRFDRRLLQALHPCRGVQLDPFRPHRMPGTLHKGESDRGDRWG